MADGGHVFQHIGLFLVLAQLDIEEKEHSDQDLKKSDQRRCDDKPVNGNFH